MTDQSAENKIQALTRAASAINFATGRSKDPDARSEMDLLYRFIRDRIEAIKKENGVKSFV
jgi:hypothetical protein